MPRWTQILVSAAMLAAVLSGCAHPPAERSSSMAPLTRPSDAVQVKQDAAESAHRLNPISGNIAPQVQQVSAEVAQKTNIPPAPEDNPVINRKAPGVPVPGAVPSPKLQPGVGERFVEPPPIPETPPAELAIETGETGPPNPPLSLESLEALACAYNPTLIQAKAQVDGVFGKAIQAGLWPNPILMYRGDQVGVDRMGADTPGEWQGAMIRQEIPTANKLDLSRSKYLQRVKTAEWLAMAQEYRVLNDVRLHFFRTLGRQEIVQIQQELLKNAEDQLVTVREGYNLGYHPRSEIHRVNALLQEQRLAFLMTENDYRESFGRLMTLSGQDQSPALLEGSLASDLTPIEFDFALQRLLAESPEVKAAQTKLQADMLTLRREEVEPIPNIVAIAGAGYNFEAVETTANVGINIEIPLWDWNQGTVKQAEADIVRQQHEVRRTELRLTNQLYQVYRNYLTALQHAQNYQDVVIPERRKAYEVLLDMYEADRVRWLDVLTAERDYFLARLTYVQNLILWRESEVLISGYLLHNGLDAPMEVSPQAHIDAVPRPR